MKTNPEEEMRTVNSRMARPYEITTIIPTFCRPNLLKRAIESALNQTYNHLRVCVYDNASDDETGDVVSGIAKKDPRVFYHRHPKNIGGLQNFNFGLKNVRTPFFSLLSDDDILLPRFYETAMKGFSDYPDSGFSATSVLALNSNEASGGLTDAIVADTYYLPPAGLLAMFKGGRYPPTWTGIVFKKDVLERLGLLDEEVVGPVDWDYLQRAAAQFPYVTSKTPGAIFVLHGAAYGAGAGLGTWWPGWLKMVANITEDASLPLVVREKFRGYSLAILKKIIFYCAKQALKRKNYEEAVQAADVLYNKLNARITAAVLYLGVKCLQWLPFLHSLIKLYVSRPRLKSAKSGEVSQYMHFLKTGK